MIGLTLTLETIREVFDPVSFQDVIKYLILVNAIWENEGIHQGIHWLNHLTGDLCLLLDTIVAEDEFTEDILQYTLELEELISTPLTTQQEYVTVAYRCLTLGEELEIYCYNHLAINIP